MNPQAWAILRAQWRTILNRLPRTGAFGLMLSILLGTVWYGGFLVLAVVLGMVAADPAALPVLKKTMGAILVLAFLFWQVVPLLLVSSGSALEVKKLAVYPIPHQHLFLIEVMLRLSTGIEPVVALAGLGLGLLFNPAASKWGPLAFLFYIVFNLLLSAGVRDLLARLMARKRIREIVMFLLVMVAALPQLLLSRGPERHWRWIIGVHMPLALPWEAAARIAAGDISLAAVASLLGWTAAAYAFGRWQFERGLGFDAAEPPSKPARPRETSRIEGLYRLPGRLFSDPLGALIEKELRQLTRSPRFRLVFAMGFSFGLVIWLPLTFGRSSNPDTWMGRNYLAVAGAYALLLLGDVLLLNAFGLDRAAASTYFSAPVGIGTVLRAKNITALFFVFVQVTVIGLVCALLRLPLSAAKLGEAYAATATIAFFALAVGNLSSVYNPRPIDPNKSLRSSSEQKSAGLILLLFPLCMAPATLAYAARWAFQSSLAFYGVLLAFLLFGLVFYRIATASAVRASERRKEQILDALSRGSGPIAA